MAHGAGTSKKRDGSVKHSKQTLSNGQKLSTTHQKEGHILIAWLNHFVRKNGGQSVTISSDTLDIPNYDEISKILASNKEKPAKSIDRKPDMKKKWEVTHNVVIPALYQRLGALDNLIQSREEEVKCIEENILRAINSLEKRFRDIFHSPTQNWEDNVEITNILKKLIGLEKILYAENHPIIPWVTEVLLEVVEN